MDKTTRLAVIGALAVALAGVVAYKSSTGGRAKSDPPPATSAAVAATAQQPPLPRLIDLGADKCIPCRAMAPILDGLRDEMRGQMEVVFIDIWRDREAGERHGVRVIPTQIFLDAQGQELFRHEGFFSRQEILDKWRDLGFEFALSTTSGAGS